MVEKCGFLSVYLDGEADRVYCDLSTEEKESWALLKTALTSRFDPSPQPELFETELLARKRESGEKLTDSGNAIRTPARKAFPQESAGTRDRIAKTHFLRALSGEMQLKLRLAEPKTLDYAIKIVRDNCTGGISKLTRPREVSPSQRSNVSRGQRSRGANSTRQRQGCCFENVGSEEHRSDESNGHFNARDGDVRELAHRLPVIAAGVVVGAEDVGPMVNSVTYEHSVLRTRANSPEVSRRETNAG